MSTEENDDQKPAVVKTKSYTITRGGIYLLEGLLQKTTPYTKVRDQRRANRLWAKLRRENPTKIIVDGLGEVDFEKSYVRPSGLQDAEWAQRQLDHRAAMEKWQREPLTIGLTPKEVELLEGVALKWALRNRKDIWPENNEHTLSVFEAFPDVFSDDDED